MGLFHTNHQEVSNILSGLPQQEFMDDLTSKIYEFSAMADKFGEHFTRTKDHLTEVIKDFLHLSINVGKNADSAVKVDEDFGDLKNEESRVLNFVSTYKKNFNGLKDSLSKDDQIWKALADSKIMTKNNKSDYAGQERVGEISVSLEKKQLVGNLRRMMQRQVRSITEDDIRGGDMPIDTVVAVAFVLIAAFGLFIFYSIGKQDNSLPIGGKRRLD